MHYIPAPTGYTALRIYTDGVNGVVERYSLHMDPLVMYAYIDSEDRPISVYPVLGAEDWELHLLDAMGGEYVWRVLPDDLVVEEVALMVDQHHAETCRAEAPCNTALMGNYRRGQVLAIHSEDCMERQEEQQRLDEEQRIARARTAQVHDVS